MWFRTKAYLKFLWRSTNEHGIHSPFVYKLVTQCFYNKKYFETYALWDRAQNEILKTETNFKTEKPCFISQKRAQLMIRLVDYLKVKNALEIGSSLGLSSLSIVGSGLVKLKTTQASVATSEDVLHPIDEFKFKKGWRQNISYIESLAESESEEKFDLIFIQSCLESTQILSSFEFLLNSIHNDSVLIVEGIHASTSMEKLWESIKAHKQVQVSIDTFQWGLVFFRKEQVKQHFVIRV